MTMGRRTIMGTYATLAFVLGFGAVSLGAKDCGSPGPVSPDVIDGAGGSPGIGGAIDNTGGSPGVGGSTPACSTTCCKSCQALRDHGCPEGRPTAKGASCEDRNCSSDLPASVKLADLSACTTLACIRAPGGKKRGVTCEGGKDSGR